MIKIFTIIVTYNALYKGWIDRCLKSLNKSTIHSTAVVIDNCSTDGTREHVPANYPDVVWMPQERNLGFGQANNIGIRYAMEHGADYVLMLNQDASLHPEALHRMLEISDEESLVSPIHLNGQGNAIDYIFRNSLRKANNSLLDDFIISGKTKDSYETGEVCAACWMIPTSIIRKIGGFNPIYFHYGEDNNYYQRLVYHKIKTLVATKAFMYHDRMIYGNVESFNKNKLHNNVLNIVCNINNSYCRIVKEMVLLLFRCYFYDLTQKQYRVGSFSKEWLWALYKLKSICRSRKNEKKEQQNWL